MKTVQHLTGFQVIELRRYTIKPGGREHFARYFESYFPEAFEQLGAIAFGDFFERTKTDHFLWLRGFKDMDARVIANSAFYFGPLWKEHRQTLNDLILDSDDVLLLQPLHPDRGVLVLPAVDVVKEERGATGIAVAQIFTVKAGEMDPLSAAAERAFEAYRGEDMKEAGVLVTLDAKNTFPQLPVRTDGPYLVWLGVFQDEQALDRFRTLADRATQTLAATGHLRGETELVVLDPAPRSRLRWLPSNP
ncbi:MAG: NIPSNAP family protein [Acidobacteriota bacterium]